MVGGDFFVVSVDQGFGFGSRQDSSLGQELKGFDGEVVATGFVAQMEIKRSGSGAVLYITMDVEISSWSILGRVLMIEEYLLQSFRITMKIEDDRLVFGVIFFKTIKGYPTERIADTDRRHF